MKIVVQKFGGTSIRNFEGFKKALVHIKKELKMGHKIVCVVSAMGRYGEPYATDTLKNLIKNNVSKKEQDRLLSIGEIITSVVFTDFLIENEIQAISLSTKEIGIFTNNNFTNADIIKINDLEILSKISEYDVIVVPGFQGLTFEEDVTTLGRGGSDTTAIALGITLKALYVEIISDVEGVFTADPRIVPKAIKIPKLNFDVLVDMTKNGSKVLHYKGAVLAKNNNIKLRFVAIDDYNSFTEVEDENVLVTNVSYKNEYIQYRINQNIQFDHLLKEHDVYYIHEEEEMKFEYYLKLNNILFDKEKGYSKITTIKYDSVKSEEFRFVKTEVVHEVLNDLHHQIFNQEG